MRALIVRLENYLSRRPTLLSWTVKILENLGLLEIARKYVSAKRKSHSSRADKNPGAVAKSVGQRNVSDRDLEKLVVLEQTLLQQTIEDATLRRTGVLVSLLDSDIFIENLLRELEKQHHFETLEIVFHLSKPSAFVREIVGKFVRLHSNATLLESEKTIGIYEAWNECIDSFGDSVEYLTNWNADDSRWQFAIHRGVSVLDKLSEFDLYYSDYIFSDTPNISWATAIETQGCVEMEHVTYRNMLSNQATPHSAPIWRRSLHSLHGGFDERYKVSGDRDFWLRVLKAGHMFFHDPIPASVYFWNPKGLSSSGNCGYEEWSRIVSQERRHLSSTPNYRTE